MEQEDLLLSAIAGVKAIDPLHASGTDFHKEMMSCLKTAIGEKKNFLNVKRIIHDER